MKRLAAQVAAQVTRQLTDTDAISDIHRAANMSVDMQSLQISQSQQQEQQPAAAAAYPYAAQAQRISPQALPLAAAGSPVATGYKHWDREAEEAKRDGERHQVLAGVGKASASAAEDHVLQPAAAAAAAHSSPGPAAHTPGAQRTPTAIASPANTTPQPAGSHGAASQDTAMLLRPLSTSPAAAGRLLPPPSAISSAKYVTSPRLSSKATPTGSGDKDRGQAREAAGPTAGAAGSAEAVSTEAAGEAGAPSLEDTTGDQEPPEPEQYWVYTGSIWETVAGVASGHDPDAWWVKARRFTVGLVAVDWWLKALAYPHTVPWTGPWEQDCQLEVLFDSSALEEFQSSGCFAQGAIADVVASYAGKSIKELDWEEGVEYQVPFYGGTWLASKLCRMTGLPGEVGDDWEFEWDTSRTPVADWYGKHRTMVLQHWTGCAGPECQHQVDIMGEVLSLLVVNGERGPSMDTVMAFEVLKSHWMASLPEGRF